MMIHGYRAPRRTRLYGLLSVALVATLRGYAEDSIDLTGEVVAIQAEDFAQHRSEIQYYLQDEPAGRALRLRFTNGQVPPSFVTGTRIRAQGSILGDEFVVQSSPKRLEPKAAATITETTEHRTLAIAVNFRNATLSCEIDAVAEMLFSETGSVAALYREMSHGAVRFAGDVVGPFTIDFDSSVDGCEYYEWAKAADAAAQAAGVPVTQYRHKVYVLPQLDFCSWTGLATVGGNPGRVWIGMCQLADVYAHELGHNLGLRHASADYNNDGRGDCEYCDNSDIMGYVGPGLRQLNAPHKEQLGWLPAGKTVSPVGSAIIKLAPLELAPQDTPYAQALKITPPNSQTTYYFSYRRRLGFDANLLRDYHDTLSVHHFAGAADRSYLVTTLADAGKFADPASGLTVSLVAHDVDSATAQVTYECYGVAPSVHLDGSTLNMIAGMTTSTVLTVLNRDCRTCTPTTFHLTAAPLPGWQITISPASLTLAPGESGIALLNVTASPRPRRDSQTLIVTATDDFNPARTVAASQVIAATLPDTVPPTPPGNTQVFQRKHSLQLRWDPASDNVGIGRYVIWRDGVAIGTTRRRRFSDATAQAGKSYRYAVTAVDAAGNSSVPSEEILLTVNEPQPAASVGILRQKDQTFTDDTDFASGTFSAQ